MSLGGSRMGLTHSLTHSLDSINLFIKLELNNVLLAPILSIVFVQEWSVVLRKVFDDGRLARRSFLNEKCRALVRIFRAHGQDSYYLRKFSLLFKKTRCKTIQKEIEIVKHYRSQINRMFPAGLEPATFRVWGGRDNHYTTETSVKHNVLLNFANVVPWSKF